MKFARWVFNTAGAYRSTTKIHRPLHIQCFSTGWQLLFFAVARQPIRLRSVIPFAVLEKLSFGIGALILYRQNRLDHNDLWFGGIDLMLAIMFLVAWRHLAQASAQA